LLFYLFSELLHKVRFPVSEARRSVDRDLWFRQRLGHVSQVYAADWLVGDWI